MIHANVVCMCDYVCVYVFMCARVAYASVCMHVGCVITCAYTLSLFCMSYVNFTHTHTHGNVGKAPEGKVMEEVVDENQTNLDQPVVFRSSVHDATVVIGPIRFVTRCVLC